MKVTVKYIITYNLGVIEWVTGSWPWLTDIGLWVTSQPGFGGKSRWIPRLLGFHGYDTASFMTSQPGLPWLGVHGKQMKIQNHLMAAVRQWAIGSINVGFVSDVQGCKSWRASMPSVRSVHTVYVNERFSTSFFLCTLAKLLSQPWHTLDIR